MALKNKIHENDIGNIFRLTVQDCDANGDPVAVDLSGATSLTFNFKKPQTDTVISRVPSFLTDGTDGVIQYTSQAGDLDEDGRWSLQAVVTIPNGTFSSSVILFPVEPNL